MNRLGSATSPYLLQHAENPDASAGYQRTDEANAALLDNYLTGSVYVAPEKR